MLYGSIHYYPLLLTLQGGMIMHNLHLNNVEWKSIINYTPVMLQCNWFRACKWWRIVFMAMCPTSPSAARVLRVYQSSQGNWQSTFQRLSMSLQLPTCICTPD